MFKTPFEQTMNTKHLLQVYIFVKFNNIWLIYFYDQSVKFHFFICIFEKFIFATPKTYLNDAEVTMKKLQLQIDWILYSYARIFTNGKC